MAEVQNESVQHALDMINEAIGQDERSYDGSVKITGPSPSSPPVTVSVS